MAVYKMMIRFRITGVQLQFILGLFISIRGMSDGVCLRNLFV